MGDHQTSAYRNSKHKWNFSKGGLKAPFCQQCGNLLDLSTKHLNCQLCGQTHTSQQLNAQSSLSSKVFSRKQNLQDEETETRAIIEEGCPKCGHERLYFTTVQLRSVDEGQTVFYECLKCKHKWSINN
eukprot:TRINITY_DN4228_c0_g1_i1.p1 TRINITY_DN4228_c0_g1~~TRINITY_DN4228_c0_g1_i1.p1  ORF type:complete len:128 (+),score=15.30 TRINITY_DN4228_c0_g1_i1:35-418(+)